MTIEEYQTIKSHNEAFNSIYKNNRREWWNKYDSIINAQYTQSVLLNYPTFTHKPEKLYFLTSNGLTYQKEIDSFINYFDGWFNSLITPTDSDEYNIFEDLKPCEGVMFSTT